MSSRYSQDLKPNDFGLVGPLIVRDPEHKSSPESLSGEPELRHHQHSPRLQRPLATSLSLMIQQLCHVLESRLIVS